MIDCRALLAEAAALLSDAGTPAPLLEAEMMLSHFSGIPRLQLRITENFADTSEWLDAFRDAVRTRASTHTPIQYLIGSVDFHGVTLAVAPGALIPRPETEQLVEHALTYLKGKQHPRVLDLCTGSGAIILAIGKARPDAVLHATEISPDALIIARRNAEKLGIDVASHEGDLYCFDTIEKFDLIVSNPPYITQSEYDELDREIREHEPILALTDHGDGLSIIRRIIAQAPQRLCPGGQLLLEIGEAQGDTVCGLLAKHFPSPRLCTDLAGKPRFAVAQLD